MSPSLGLVHVKVDLFNAENVTSTVTRRLGPFSGSGAVEIVDQGHILATSGLILATKPVTRFQVDDIRSIACAE